MYPPQKKTKNEASWSTSSAVQATTQPSETLKPTTTLSQAPRANGTPTTTPTHSANKRPRKASKETPPWQLGCVRHRNARHAASPCATCLGASPVLFRLVLGG